MTWCLLYVAVPVLKKELQEYVAYWNSHVIRANNRSGSPSCVSNEMYQFPTLYSKYCSFAAITCFTSGARDQATDLDVDLWLHSMANESEELPAFIPPWFETWADDAIDDIGAIRGNI